MAYPHKEIEKKWQERWEKEGAFRAEDASEKKKFYCLIEFPYPSGSGLHVGHVRSYASLDALSRKRRMEGFNVLYPIGWDAFGLPTENYAIKTERKPQDVTKENTDTFRRQLKALGLSFDWSREVNTTDPNYYKWTQWMFLQFFKADLAYKAKTLINWCPKDKIGLANEEAAGGVCDRCGGPVEKREKEQWMIAITKYADRLLSDLDTVNYLPKIKKQQQDWIGKSEGAEIDFALVGIAGQEDGRHNVRVFTTRPDTIFGATFVVVSPELAKTWIDVGWQANTDVQEYVTKAMLQKEEERTAEDREKTGVAAGIEAINPANGARIPVWVADYVLGHYGTGAIMAVPGHDERDFAFAKKFGLPIVTVVKPEPLASFMPSVVAGATAAAASLEIASDCWSGEGVNINSALLDGMKTKEAKEKMIGWLEEQHVGTRAVRFKLRDWVFSRQRYWGEPIPLVRCEHCASTGSAPSGWVPVPDEQLPVVLPDVEKYEPTDTGESPLATIERFVNTTCPTCGAPAKRETDTMPNWAGSSWYFLAYLMKGVSPNYQLPITNYQAAFKHWMPVDLYNGGMEHTTLHLLYSRFWNKFLFDQGFVPTSEPYARRHSHGLVLAEDGTKMSKSKGNVVNPDEIVEQYGADALRMYEMFMGPFEEPVPWSTNGLVGVRRFLEKVCVVSEKVNENVSRNTDLERTIHKTIKKVGSDIEAMKFNTAIAELMKCVNAMQEVPQVPRNLFETFLKLLYPFAPHVASELLERLNDLPAGRQGSTTCLPAGKAQRLYDWPAFDPQLAKDEMITLAVQVNGKLRSTIEMVPEASQQDAEFAARADENIIKWLEGQEIKKVVYVAGRMINFVL